MLPLLLLVHLFGAAATGITILLSLVSLVSKQKNRYPQLAMFLGAISVFQLFSGAALSIVSVQRPSAAVFCSRLGVYLIAVLATEYLLYRHMSRKGRQYAPIRSISSSITLGVFVSIASYVLQW